MANDKLEPRLAEFIGHQKARAAAKGAAAAPEELIEVTISHTEDLRAEEARDRSTSMMDLGERIRNSHGNILGVLRKLKTPEPYVHSLVNAVTAKVTAKQLDDITALDEVKLVRLEIPEMVTCMNESVRVIESVDAAQDFGANGRGIKVALLDTGIDKNHPALLGKVVDEISTVAESINIPGLHATHTAGTIASNDVVFRGVAPQADLINIKVLDHNGFGSPASVIKGLEQAVRRGALVASMSLGWSEIFMGWVCNNADCILCQAADNTVRLGVTLVVAAGNEGAAGARPPFAIRHPGAARKVITVGAVDKAKLLAPFSSTGPGSGRLSPASPIRLTKPDVTAPGVNIVSSVLGGGFASLSGTSMATPHVAGLAAMILQKNASLAPTMVKKLISDTCEPLENTPNQVGYGIINAYTALLRAVGIAPRAVTAGVGA
ncbi:MAG TPA: S8 family serine peptidase [Methylomirabilota bacterium]|nr:S8 family serine peptidase [Methylomirabilota bacterium]